MEFYSWFIIGLVYIVSVYVVYRIGAELMASELLERWVRATEKLKNKIDGKHK